MLGRVPPPPASWPWLALAALAGGGLGWLRGGLMRIEVDPATHAMNVRASPAALAFIMGLVVARFVLRRLFAEMTGGWAGGALLVADGFLLFAVGLVTAQRVEMAIRARRLLAEARAARLAQDVSSS